MPGPRSPGFGKLPTGQVVPVEPPPDVQVTVTDGAVGEIVNPMLTVGCVTVVVVVQGGGDGGGAGGPICSSPPDTSVISNFAKFRIITP